MDAAAVALIFIGAAWKFHCTKRTNGIVFVDTSVFFFVLLLNLFDRS